MRLDGLDEMRLDGVYKMKSKRVDKMRLDISDKKNKIRVDKMRSDEVGEDQMR